MTSARHPDTLMRWHRRLIAWKWTDVARRVGRPGLRQASSDLIVQRALVRRIHPDIGIFVDQLPRAKRLDHRVEFLAHPRHLRLRDPVETQGFDQVLPLLSYQASLNLGCRMRHMPLRDPAGVIHSNTAM